MSEEEPVVETVKFNELAINQMFELDGELFKRLHQKGCCGRKKVNALKISTDTTVFINKHEKVIPK